MHLLPQSEESFGPGRPDLVPFALVVICQVRFTVVPHAADLAHQGIIYFFTSVRDEAQLFVSRAFVKA